MKKILLLLIVCATLVSCENEAINPTAYTPVNQKLGPTQPLRVFHDDVPIWYCDASGGNCLPDYTVPSKRIGIINSVFGVVHSGNEVAIKIVFQNYKNVLMENMREEHVDGVISGGLKAEARGTNPNEPRYLILNDALNGNQIAVYPYVK